MKKNLINGNIKFNYEIRICKHIQNMFSDQFRCANISSKKFDDEV